MTRLGGGGGGRRGMVEALKKIGLMASTRRRGSPQWACDIYGVRGSCRLRV